MPLPDGLTWMGEPLTEDALTGILQHERARSVGLDDDEQLNDHRERALEYLQGIVDDLPVAVDDEGKPVDSNRSSATTTDLADMVETIMPDIMEVFFGGEDALTFKPQSKGDVDAAEQETDYMREVIFHRNDGFQNVYDAIKESLLCRVGPMKYWWSDDADYETYEGETYDLNELQAQGIEIVEVTDEQIDPETNLMQYSFTARKMVRPPRACWKAWPSSDFAAAPETMRLRDANYVVFRSRPQKQDLIADGYDADIVRALPDEYYDTDAGVEMSRNTSDEDDDESVAMGDLAEVEVMEHYLRADFEGSGRPQIYRIITADNEKVILDIEKRPRIEAAVLSPYPMPFRLYGLDLADKIMPYQKITTALLRNGLDNNAFQLNQRLGIAEDDSTDDTLDDVLDNDPGAPIRMRRAGAVFPIVSAPLSINPFQTMEQIKTIEEQSSGVQRLNQGLNPDALHDTKGGMQIQHNEGQKRIRMMARLFAENGFRDLFEGMHDLVRSNASYVDTVELRGRWVDVSPNDFQRRNAMRVEIGVGSGGRDADIAALQLMAARTAEIVQSQGGLSGPLVTADNVFNLYKALGDRLGLKAVTQFITNPVESPEQPPENSEAMMELEAKKAEMEAKQMLELKKLEADVQLRREQMEREMQLKREQMMAELKLKREQMALQSRTSAEITEIRPGGAVG